MLLYMVLISPMEVIDMKMISECPIVSNWQSVIELLVSELGVVDQRFDKEGENLWLLPNVYSFLNTIPFELLVFRVYVFGYCR